MNDAMLVYRANRVEDLLAAMAERVSFPLASPLTAETIIVQSRGMSTWLSMQLSSVFGIWANPDFPHPRQFVQRVLRATLGEEGDLIRRYSRERLCFALFDLLADCPTGRSFAPLRGYLSDADPARRLQLARQIAQLFDQYGIYRPEMVLAWEEGEGHSEGCGPDDLWQPELWRRVIRRLHSPSPPRLIRRCRAALAEGRIPFPQHLPERVSIFGIDSLPVAYLGIFSDLAARLPVCLYLFAPSEAFIGLIRSEAEINRLQARLPVSLSPADLYFESGHPLLASFGGPARDFQEILENHALYRDAGESFVENPSPRTMLAVLQDDILNLVHRCCGSAATPPLALAEEDDSIAVHVCHSRLREVEVLQDRLLGLLHDEHELEPRDIVIMLPEVEAYAPLIDAVFGLPGDDPRFIPYRVADRPELSELPLVELFFSSLALINGRLSAPELLDLLAAEPILRRFGLGPEDLVAIRRWVERAGIRWGIDEEHRRDFGQPADRQNTWRFGFDRLILGSAVFDEEQFCGGILPCGGIEGQAAETAGRFFAFCETLFAARQLLRSARKLPDWAETLAGLLIGLFAAESPESWQLQKIRDALAAMVEEGQDAAFAGEIDLASCLLLLREKLSTPTNARGFLAGGLTFCGMLPMRSIPFKVVCLLGMNDGEFPRAEHPQGFDLIARNARPGDRSKRQEDRYLFLEALLAARSRLLIFYVGRSQKDNSPLPPAGVVEELFDCLAAGFEPPLPTESPAAMAGRRERLVARLSHCHPLQPFSPRYFNGVEKGLFSFSESYCRALRLEGAGPRQRPVFVAGLEACEKQTAEGLNLDDLQRFFRHPVRFFLENRLGLALSERNRELKDREPLMLDALEKHRLAGDLLEAGLGGEAGSEALLARWHGEGLVPLGAAARQVFAEIGDNVRPLLKELAPFAALRPLPPLNLELSLGPDLTLAGELNGRYPCGHLRWTQSRLHGRVLLAAWLDHLFLCAARPADQEPVTILIGRGRERGSADCARLRPLASAEEAAARLADLAGLLRAGYESALPFFPKSSWTFVQAMMSAKGDDAARRSAALAKALEEYTGNRFSIGEGDDPWCRQLFAGRHPIDADFAELSLRVFLPLYDHLEFGPQEQSP